MLRRVAGSVGGWGANLFWAMGLVLVCGAVGVAGGPPAAKPADQSLTRPQRDAFQWFDGLGFPVLKDRPLVRVATGWWSQSGDDPPQNKQVLAFLLKSEGDQFTVFTLHLDTHTFTSTPPATPEHERVGYEKLDLKEQATAYVQSLRALQSQSKDSSSWHFRHMSHFGPHLSEEAEMFLLAQVCEAAGLETEAKELFDFAEGFCRQEARGDEPRSLRAAVARKIAHKEMWTSVLAFGNPKISRKELLKRFERIVKHFPNSEHAKRARETAETLRQMVREDEEHARQAKPLEKADVAERVADLIFRLRDQNGQQWSQPGRCDIFLDPDGFFDPDGEGKTPAHQLVKIGFDAVPALIEALGDRRFTRSVGYHRNFYFSHYVLRVGDCAREILERIAAREFYQRRSTSSEMSTDDVAGGVKRQVRAWWDEVQRKGEKQVLIEAVERADQNSPWQAQRLLEEYPDAALAAIVRGATKTEDVWTRERLIDMAAGIKGDSPVPFLLQQMKQASRLAWRVVAARGLMRRGHPDALPAMIEEWKRLAAVIQDSDRRFADSGTEMLIGLLAGSGSEKAVRALAEGFQERSVEVKLNVVSAFGPSGNMSVIGGSLAPAEAKVDNESLRAAVEDLLVRALDDMERRMGMSATWGEKSFDDPRLGDVAGHVLWMRWPKKYVFDIEASAAVRDRQRVELKNVWRKQRGLPPIELPQPPQIHRLSEEELRPLWKAVLRAADETQRTKAVAAVDALGLSALPAARRLLAAIDDDAAARPTLEALVRRLSVVVREVVVEAKTLPDDHPLAKELTTVADKPLTAERFVELVLAYTQQPPQQLPGVTLSAERAGDDTGVVVRLSAVDRKAFQAGSQKGWDHSECVTAGRKALLGSSGSSSYGHQRKADAYDDFARALGKALSRPPDEPFEAIISVVQER